VTIALENIFDHRCLTYVFDRVASPNLGFCYDAGHRNCKEPDIDLLSLFGDKLVALHLHDNDGTGDQHRVPFEGKIDWKEQMSRIAAKAIAAQPRWNAPPEAPARQYPTIRSRRKNGSPTPLPQRLSLTRCGIKSLSIFGIYKRLPPFYSDNKTSAANDGILRYSE
jgi:hypothetical protein